VWKRKVRLTMLMMKKWQQLRLIIVMKNGMLMQNLIWLEIVKYLSRLILISAWRIFQEHLQELFVSFSSNENDNNKAQEIGIDEEYQIYKED
ncbi:hypothetical protein HN51_046834, partial [Arachis hypogaea]